jgi:hypothetical protein
MDTGFISLEHDRTSPLPPSCFSYPPNLICPLFCLPPVYPVTVDLAVYYFLPDALSRQNPSLKLTSIIECQGKPISEAYLETAGSLVFSNSSAPASGGSSAVSSALSEASTMTGSMTGMTTSTRAGSSASAAPPSGAAASAGAAAAATSVGNTSGTSSSFSLVGTSSVVALGAVAGAFALLF